MHERNLSIILCGNRDSHTETHTHNLHLHIVIILKIQITIFFIYRIYLLKIYIFFNYIYFPTCIDYIIIIYITIDIRDWSIIIYQNLGIFLLCCMDTTPSLLPRKIRIENQPHRSRSSVKVLNWWMSRGNEKHFIVSGTGTPNRTCPSLLFGLEKRKLNGHKLNSEPWT